MSTWGRVVDGKTIDVFTTPSPLPSWAATDQAFVDKVRPSSILMPNGTQNGATDNGDGTYTNPAVAAPMPIPLTLSRQEFRKHILKQISKVKFQEYMDIARANNASTDADKKMRAAYDQFRDDESYTKSDADDLLKDLGYTNNDRNQVINNWPVQ